MESCRCSWNALGWTSACGAAGASGPVLGSDRSRCIKREGCGRGGCVAEYWCPVVPQGWRDAASRSCAGVGALSVVHRAGGDRGPARGWLWVREIARRLGRAPSTISRELQRNAAIGRGRVEYRASTAQRHAERRARRPKPAKLAVNAQLRAFMCRVGFLARCSGLMGASLVQISHGGGGVTGRARIGVGDSAGARSRSLNGCAWTSPMMNRCACPMRRSISRSMSRAAGRCAGS